MIIFENSNFFIQTQTISFIYSNVGKISIRGDRLTWCEFSEIFYENWISIRNALEVGQTPQFWIVQKRHRDFLRKFDFHK
mgnify:CR=1 FL=1